MAKYSIRKSELWAGGYFSRPAFNLLRPETDLHGTVTTFLSDHCPIRGADIRIDQETNPLGDASVAYDLGPFDGVARVFVDRAGLYLSGPHTIKEPATIASLVRAFFGAVRQVIADNSYERFAWHVSFHAVLEETAPADHTQRYLSPVPAAHGPIAGGCVTYYFGQDGPKTHSSVTLDMSEEFSDCVYVRVATGFDGNRISGDEVPELATGEYDRLLPVIGLESE